MLHLANGKHSCVEEVDIFEKEGRCLASGKTTDHLLEGRS